MPNDIITTQVTTQPTVVEVKPTNVLTSIVEDHTGGTSSMRVLMLVWGIGVLAIWGFGTVMAALHGVYVAPVVPDSIVTILLGITGGKIVQRYGEK